MKATVIYHSADYDGIFCREIARKFLPDAELIGWNFGDPPIELEAAPEDMLYVMDLPCDAPFGLKMHPSAGSNKYAGFGNLIWIDHHASSIESHPPFISGYRIDGVAACRLAWQWFSWVPKDRTLENLPDKQRFIDRKVEEPLAVRLAGEYDIWDKRDWRADTFQYGLWAHELKPFEWEKILSDKNTKLEQIIGEGLIAQSYAQNVDASICNSLTWLMEWEGLKFLCVNHARFNSLLFTAKDKPETGHDALLGFRFDGKSWMVSLYHAAHRKDLDLSAIAVKHGGGGHKGACGFTCQKLPFMPASDL